MTGKAWSLSWFRATDTMLGQVRTMFFVFLLAWPVFGLWTVVGDADGWMVTAAFLAIALLMAWLFVGYRRQHFPAWSWVGEGVCVGVVAAASDYGGTIALCFMWVNFRALYGSTRDKVLAAVVLLAVTGAGAALFGRPLGDVVPLLLTAWLALAINHVLARGSRARDRSADREGTLAFAGAGLVAATTRDEAMDVTLGAALSLDPAVRAALLFTVAGPALHVVAAAGDAGPDTAGWVAEVASLPAAARDALRQGDYAVLTGDDAVTMTTALRLPGHRVVELAPMAAHGSVFGMLILALDQRTADDLSAAVTTLADEVALTLDQLLSRSRLSIVVEHSPDALVLAGEAGFIRFTNPAAVTMLGCEGTDLLGRNIWSLLHPDDVEAVRHRPPAAEVPATVPCRIRGRDDAEWVDVEALVEYVSEHDGSRSIVFTARDVSERHRLELELRHAQKLESVGRLAAGIAHEINTPIQFVGDNARFLEGAFADVNRLHAEYTALAEAVRAGGDVAAALAAVDAAANEVDIDFVMEEVPMAISQTLEGISRVANIVRAMKAFGHPGTEQKSRADLGEAIRNTLVVAANEIKYVADVETDLGELPLVQCHLGDINQVVLNLVVNAAHAITAADRGRGVIRVRTRLDGDHAVIEIEDSGTGVPPEIADKLFDPFFTTKEVGTGTGQGLALVRTLVTDRHGGTVDFTSEHGKGTTFTVRLPVDGTERSAGAAELTATAP